MDPASRRVSELVAECERAVPALMAADLRDDRQSYVMLLDVMLREGAERGITSCFVWATLFGVAMRNVESMADVAAKAAGLDREGLIAEMIAKVNA